MAYVAVSKFADHRPLNRLEGIFRRYGVVLSRAAMGDGMAACAGRLDPRVTAMTRRILASRVIGTEDTPVKVQDHDGPGIKTDRRWVDRGDSDNPFVVSDSTPDRSRDGPERCLKGSKAGDL
jgi:hypothetical protein